MTTEIESAILAPAHDYLAGTYGAGIAEGALKELLTHWEYNYKQWEVVRLAFIGQKPLDMTSDAADKAWQRLVKSFGLKKPKAQTADAIIQAAKREKAAKALADVDDATLTKRIQLLEDNGLSASKLKTEAKRRQAEKDAPVKEAKDKALAEIKAALPKADLKILEKIHKLLKLA